MGGNMTTTDRTAVSPLAQNASAAEVRKGLKRSLLSDTALTRAASFGAGIRSYPGRYHHSPDNRRNLDGRYGRAEWRHRYG